MRHLWPVIQWGVEEGLIITFAGPEDPTTPFEKFFIRIKYLSRAVEFEERVRLLEPLPLRRFQIQGTGLPPPGWETMTVGGLIAYYELCVSPEAWTFHKAQKRGAAQIKEMQGQPPVQRASEGTQSSNSRRLPDIIGARRKEFSQLTKKLDRLLNSKGSERQARIEEHLDVIKRRRRVWATAILERKGSEKLAWDTSKAFGDVIRRAGGAV